MSFGVLFEHIINEMRKKEHEMKGYIIILIQKEAQGKKKKRKEKRTRKEIINNSCNSINEI